MACNKLKMLCRFIPLSLNIKGFSQIAFWDNTSSEMKDSCNNLGFLSKLIGTSFVARGTADKGCQLSVLHPLVQVESSPHRRRSWNQWRGRSWRSHPGLPALGRRRNLRENGWENQTCDICIPNEPFSKEMDMFKWNFTHCCQWERSQLVNFLIQNPLFP